MQFDEILSYFDVEHRSADTAQCRCPAHDDRKASLTVSRGDRGILLHCHAGCSTEAVLGAAGLTECQLFYDDAAAAGKETGKAHSGPGKTQRWMQYVERRSGKQIEGVYHYQDLSGQYCYTKLRLTGKEIRYGILSDGRFTYGLGGASRERLKGVYPSAQHIRSAIAAGETVFYCEGEKDADTLTARGYAALTAGGAGDWQSCFAEIFRDGDVIVLSDNDDPGVQSAREICRNLSGTARSVRMLIPTPDLKKGDISDYFEAHDIADFEVLLQQLRQGPGGRQQAATDEAPVPRENSAPAVRQEHASAAADEAPAVPDSTAEAAADEAPSQPDLDEFHFISGSGKVTGIYDFRIFEYICRNYPLFILGGKPWLYEHGVYVPDDTGARLKTLIRSLIYPQFITSGALNRIYELFLSDATLRVDYPEVNRFPAHWICFRNSFYDPKAHRLVPHDPKYRCINQIPHVFDPEAKHPGSAVEEWLDYITPELDNREMLLQYCGYCLCRDVSQQKFLMLHGEGGTGKSIVLRMVEEMIGLENISSISITELSQRFAGYGLLGKLLNSCADLEIRELEDVSLLKKALGEDSLRVEQKGRDAITIRSYAKMLFSINELPNVRKERTNGFYRRLLILKIGRVPQDKNTDFFGRLQAELDYLIRLSVDALERMYQSGQIHVSEASEEAVLQMKFDSDTVEAWLQEKCSRVSGSRVERGACYNRYKAYCTDNERQPLQRANFYKAMRTKGFGEIRSATERYITGISFERAVSAAGPEADTEAGTDFPEFVILDDQEELPFAL